MMRQIILYWYKSVCYYMVRVQHVKVLHVHFIRLEGAETVRRPNKQAADRRYIKKRKQTLQYFNDLHR